MIVFKDLPWHYAELLDWKIENGVVKAVPKRLLSDQAHKTILATFKRWGGKFVSHNGTAYFELVVDPVSSVSTSVAVGIRQAYERLQKEP